MDTFPGARLMPGVRAAERFAAKNGYSRELSAAVQSLLNSPIK